MSYQDIPLELQAIPQWCVWRYEDTRSSKPTKVPYFDYNKHTNVNDPLTWLSFNKALELVNNGFNGIGFVFTKELGMTFIDLDNVNGDQIALERQIKIFREFDSYAEVSPSNTGLHIIVRGSVPSGRRRSNIEIYSNQRYATFTGNVYHNAPIADRQNLLTQLWEQMGGHVNSLAYNGNEAEKQTDKDVIEQAGKAVNGDKFYQLFTGEWNALYPSQSEADLALVNIIAFYTQNKNQITRIFRQSVLGQRDKAKRSDYIGWMINKAFDQMLPPIDFDGFKNAIETKIAQQIIQQRESLANAILNPGQLTLDLNGPVAQSVEPVPHKNLVASSSLARTTTTKKPLTVPPGLIGEIAQFIHSAAPRQVPEIALGAALALLAGICGRAYNVSGTGLNQYILVLADTGSGKEGGTSGIDKLMNAIKLQVPTSNKFIGPAEISSGQALVKHLNHSSQCFVSILGEFGLRIQSMSSDHASSAERSLKRVLLDLYNKSGYGQVFRGSIYADKEKNIEPTQSPAFSILGESTPEIFYNSLTDEMISEGLLPRFMLIEYTGPRPALNKNASFVQPTFHLVEKLGSLVAQCEMVMNANPRRVINIQIDREAEKILDSFEEYSTNLINQTKRDTVKQLWNRAHMKALKISGLIAVGINNLEPMITAEYVNWAIDMVQSDIDALSIKFETGLVGANTTELKQVVEFKRMLKEYLTKNWSEIAKYCVREDLYYARIVPLQYFNRRLSALACYRLDKNGATFALKRVIQALVSQDVIREIGKKELSDKFGTTQQAFMLSHFGLLD